MILAPLALVVSTLAAAAPAKAPSWGVAGFSEKLAAVRKPLHQWTSVSMRVRGGGFCDVYEPSLRINLSGSRWSGGLTLQGVVDGVSTYLNANPFGRGWSISGSGVNLTLDSFGRGWQLHGSVDGRWVNLQIDPFGSGFSIWGQGGVNLNASRFAGDVDVNGSVDLAQFNKRQLAAFGAAMALLAPVKVR